MKKTLIIGSTCLDVTVSLPHFPSIGEDAHISSIRQALGGCAYNVSDIIHKFNLPYILGSPVGTGLYGQTVETKMKEAGIRPFVHITNIENGCCFCVVDNDGNQTFLSKHGAEYRFRSSWFKNIDWDDIDSIYFCGLEIEDVDGNEIIDFLEERREYFDQKNQEVTYYFAPGPRIEHITHNKLQRIMQLHPVIHLNDREARLYSQTQSIEEAAKIIHATSCNSVIITMGDRGAYCFDHENHKGYPVPSVKTKAVDSTGAGDSHCGTIIACRKLGKTLIESIMQANKVSAAVVKVSGASLPQEVFNSLF
ncbi:MAG: carbohydrate kinase family protein [Treponema sp.]|nr:carbohydrate kinase family protein [Treponema sp.]